MTWQNIVLSIGVLVFVIALIPALRTMQKPPVQTSILYAVIVMGFTVVDVSFKLYLAAVLTFVNALQWLALAVQARRRHE
jgi:hypothetical protein